MMETLDSDDVFPQWMLGISDYIRFCCADMKAPGIYCIEYPSTLDEKIRGVVGGMFSAFSGTLFHYTGFEFIDTSRLDDLDRRKLKYRLGLSETPAILYGQLNDRIKEFIEENTISRGDDVISVSMEDRGEEITELLLEIDGVPQSLTNESYRTLLFATIAANTALETKRSICFMMDMSRLDNSFTDYVVSLFSHIEGDLIKDRKFIILMFSEGRSNNYFTENYLWSESTLSNFATIGEKGARRLSSYEESKQTIEVLATQLKEKGVISLHLGAGAASGSEVLSTGEMLKLALRELLNVNQEVTLDEMKSVFCKQFKQDSKNVTLESVMSRLGKKMTLSETQVLKKFRKSMQNATPSQGYRILGRLSTQFRIVVSTTNFDDLCEKSVTGQMLVLYDDKRCRRAHTDNSLENGKMNVLLKLHGDANETPLSLGIQSETTEELDQEMETVFRSILQGKHVSNGSFYMIFIGYKFGDEDIWKALDNEMGKDRKFIPIIVTPRSGDGIKEFRKAIDAGSKSISSYEVNMSFDVFMSELSKVLIPDMSE